MVRVVTAVRRELRELGAQDSALGASALALAARLDDAGVSAQGAAAAGRELRETLGVLRAATAEGEADRMSVFERQFEAAP